jgi:gluconolactonase
MTLELAANTVVVAQGMEWGEGPTWLPSLGGYVFTDIPADTIYLCRGDQVESFRTPSAHANGNTTDREGRLVTCEHYRRRVTRTELDGSITTIADIYEGKPFNSPNDVVVARDGSVWFTDPPYGIMRGECEPGAVAEQPSGVYRVDVSGRIDRVIDTLDKPNGLAFSTDESTLYVSDTGYSHRLRGNHHIFAFEMVGGRPLSLSIFATIDPGGSDGFRVDRLGNIWTSAGDGVHCLSPDGVLIGRVILGEMTTNLCFLVEEGKRGVFVTTPTRALVCHIDTATHPPGFCTDPRGID